MYKPQKIAEMIKTAMKERGVTNKELAANIDKVTINTVSSIANGRNPSAVVLTNIAEYLNVSVDYLSGSQALTNEEPTSTDPGSSELYAQINQLSDKEIDRLRSFLKFLIWERDHSSEG